MIKMIRDKFLLAVVTVLVAQVCFASALLPEIPGWTLVQVGSRDMLSAKGPQGVLEEYSYRRDSDDRSIKAFILSGTAFGTQKNRPSDPRGADDPMGDGGSFQVKTIYDIPVVIETVPHIGIALSMAISKDTTIVLEAPEKMAQEVENIALAIGKGI